jgi:hypothetical protein
MASTPNHNHPTRDRRGQEADERRVTKQTTAPPRPRILHQQLELCRQIGRSLLLGTTEFTHATSLVVTIRAVKYHRPVVKLK